MDSGSGGLFIWSNLSELPSRHGPEHLGPIESFGVPQANVDAPCGNGTCDSRDGTLENAREDAYQGDPREMESRSAGEYPEQRVDFLQKRK